MARLRAVGRCGTEATTVLKHEKAPCFAIKAEAKQPTLFRIEESHDLTVTYLLNECNLDCLAEKRSGQRRVPVSALPVLAKALGVSLEELLGESSNGGRKRGPAPKLQQHMEKISGLPKSQQRFVLQVLESVLAHASR